MDNFRRLTEAIRKHGFEREMNAVQFSLLRRYRFVSIVLFSTSSQDQSKALRRQSIRPRVFAYHFSFTDWIRAPATALPFVYLSFATHVRTCSTTEIR